MNIDPKKELSETGAAVKEKVSSLFVIAFGLAAAVAWNEAVQSLLKIIFPANEGLTGKIVYALILTVVLVVLSKISGKKKQESSHQ